MKTNQQISLAICIIVLQLMSSACQKQEVVANPLSSGNLVQFVKGDSSINGLISAIAANELSAAFIEQRGNKETRLVKVAVKDLINYMHQMQTNAITDSLGIYFGYYTAATVPSQVPQYLHKYTLYFSVFPAASSTTPSLKTFGNGASAAFLNHGTLYP